MKLLLLCAFLAADSSHPNFTGTWHLDTAKSEIHSKVELSSWAIQQDDNSIAIDEEIKGHTDSMKCGLTERTVKRSPRASRAK